MKAADAFGLVVRTAGLAAVLYGLQSIAEGIVRAVSFASLTGAIPSGMGGGRTAEVTATSLGAAVVIGIAAIVCGVTLVPSAEVLVRLAYPPSWGIEVLPPGLAGSGIPRSQA